MQDLSYLDRREGVFHNSPFVDYRRDMLPGTETIEDFMRPKECHLGWKCQACQVKLSAQHKIHELQPEKGIPGWHEVA